MVSGSFEHSVLIAGLSDDGPLVWDPDMERHSGAARRRLQAMVEGGLSLRFWAEREKVRKFTVVEYELRVKG